MVKVIVTAPLTGEQIADLEAKHGPCLRYAGGKNAGLPKTRKVRVPDYTRPKTRMGKDYYTFPRQVEPDPEWESDDPGVYSTASEVIDLLKERGDDVPFLKDYVLLNDVLKDLSTYYRVGDEGAEKGMLTLLHEDGTVHPQFRMVGTATTRLACQQPNLANLPRSSGDAGDYVSQAKSLFVSRFPGGTRGQFDFSSLEVWTGAYLTRSPQLLEDLANGLNMHILRAAGAAGVPYAQAMAEFEADPKGVWKQRRQEAKVTGFRKQYGSTAKSTAKFLRIPEARIQAIYDYEAERYPEWDAFNDAVQAAVEASAEPLGKVIPHPSPLCPGVMVPILEGGYRGPDGQLYTFRSGPASPVSVKRGKRTSFKPTELKNYPTQGLGSSFMKAAIGAAVREIFKRPELWDTVLLTTTVHDSVTADFAPGFEAPGMQLLGAAMARASVIMRALGVHVTYPVPAEGETGPNLGTLTTWKDNG